MPGTDWVRTRLDVRERGGAKVTAFSLKDAERAIRLSHDSAEDFQPVSNEQVSREQLWCHLQRLLEKIVPVAETAGITLTMHPDDPPLPQFDGSEPHHCAVSKISSDWLNWYQVRPTRPVFCQGNFAAMGVDIPTTIRRLWPHIKYVHFRDVEGSADDFKETFHDNWPDRHGGPP